MVGWYKILIQQFIDTPILHWIGVGFGVLEVLLAKSNKVWLYPCGIISILITLFVLYEAGLYAEILLNLYYLIMSIYGWYYWVSKPNRQEVQISWCSNRDWLVCSVLLLLGFPLLSFALMAYTDSTVPIWDGWVSITAWVGMWLLAKRKIENWIWLNVSNAFAIPLLFHKGLFLYALLTIFLFIIAIFGYFSWRKQLKQQLQLE